MRRGIGIILAVVFWGSAPQIATGAGEQSGGRAAGDGRSVETGEAPGNVVYLQSLEFVDEGGNAVATRPAFDPATTSYATVLDEDTGAVSLEMRVGPGIGVGVAFQIVQGGMTMSRYVDLTKAGENRGSTVSYRHAFSRMATRGLAEIIVRLATTDGLAANTYAIVITRREPDLVCRVGQTLDAGQRCSIPGGGVFEIQEDGCTTGLTDVAGELVFGEGSMGKSGFCIRGYVQKGGFRAVATAATVWCIESLP